MSIFVDLPSLLRPSIKAFEKAGFRFGEELQYGRKAFSHVAIPDGWTYREVGSYGLLFFDELRRCRGISDYYSGRTDLFTRYYFEEVKDGSEITINGRDSVTGRILCLSGGNDPKEKNMHVQNVLDGLEAEYPDWKDPTAYWDD